MNKYFGFLLLCICGLPGCWNAEEKAAIAKLKPTKDPIQEEIYGFRLKMRALYNNRRFSELEPVAAEIRRTKPRFDNGSWKIAQFYEPLLVVVRNQRACGNCMIAFTRTGSRNFQRRLQRALLTRTFLESTHGTPAALISPTKLRRKAGDSLANGSAQAGRTLGEARQLSDKDPFWWVVALGVALGQHWPKNDYDQLLENAKAFEPKFWGYDTARAISLLPRWYGEPGDWEAYAEQVAARPDGLGAEIYARIVMSLHGYYDNVFRETKASWPKVRQGLIEMRQKYPRSFDLLNQTALLSTLGDDRELAQESFGKLGDSYLPSVWGKPEHFVRSRTWAETGVQ
jgi:hypothetical protein